MATIVAGIEAELREIKTALICLCDMFAQYAGGRNSNIRGFAKIFNEYFEETDGKAK